MAEGKLRPDGHANPLERARAAARGPREEDPTAEARRVRARQGAQGPRFLEGGRARSLGGAQGIREGHRALPQTALRRGRAALRRPHREASGGEGIPRPRADVPRGVPRWKEDEGHRRSRAGGAVPRRRVRKEPRQCRQGARPPTQERGSPRRRRPRALPHGLLLRASGGRLNITWDLQARVGNQRLAYQRTVSPLGGDSGTAFAPVSTAGRVDTVLFYGGGVRSL